MFASMLPALRMLAVLTVLTGIVYPLVVTGIAQVVFPRTANGSLIVDADKAVGSDLIGQPFDDPKYFWSRPSATSPMPYNGASSSGSNQGPHISVAAADYQVARVAKARNMSIDDVRSIVAANTSGRTFGILGEPRVNVLTLNRALDHAGK